MSGLGKNTVILSNHSRDEVFRRVRPKYHKRLRRRTIWAEVGADPWLLFYLRPGFREFAIEPELVLFHFWFNALKLQSQADWRQQLAPGLAPARPSYAEFCRTHKLKKRLLLPVRPRKTLSGFLKKS